MKCPRCGGKTGTKDVVQNPDRHETYRMKICSNCGHLFYTIEKETKNDDRFTKKWWKYYRKKVKTEE